MLRYVYYLLILLCVSVSGCGGGGGETSVDTNAGYSRVTLVWPEGFSYDPSTARLTGPSSYLSRNIPAYVTGITLTISGDDMEPVSYAVSLETGEVDYSVTPGERVFSIVVNTDIGVTFTGSVSVFLNSGPNGDVSLQLAVNAPPSLTLTASSSNPYKSDATKLTAVVTDDDSSDTHTYTWHGGGGTITGSGSSVTFSADKSGSYTVRVRADDGNGGVATASSTLNAKNHTPVIISVTADNSSPAVGEVVTVVCKATDKDGDSMKYGWIDSLGWKASGSSASYTMNQAGSVTLTCGVDDGDTDGRTTSMLSLNGTSAAPPSPGNITISPENGGATLTWNSSDQATTYNLYYDTQPGVTPFGNTPSGTVSPQVTKISGITSPYSITGLANGITYYFVMTAVNNGVESVASSEFSVTPSGDIPSGLSAVAGDSEVVISWNGVTGATSYNLYWNTTGSVSGADQVIAGVASPYTHKSLTNNTTYHYVVTSVTASGESSTSPEVSATPSGGIPTGVTAAPGDSQITISWNPVAGASSYNLYCNTSGGATTADTIIRTVTSPYTRTGLTNGTTYYCVVTSVNATGESGPSAEVSATPSAGVPSGVTAVTGDGSVTLSWDPVAGATSYNIYCNTTGGVTTADTSIAGVTSPYTRTGLTNGTTYYCIVTSVSSVGESAPSAEVSATPSKAPTNVKATAGDSQVTLTWDPVTGATSYNLYCNTTGGVTKADTSITGVTSPYTRTGLTNGTTYYCIVTATNANGESAPSVEVSATPFVSVGPGTPVNVTVTTGDTQVTIAWDAVAGATSYNIYCNTTGNPDNTSPKVIVTNPTYTRTNLTNGTTYYCVVSAVDSTGESNLSNQVSVAPMGSPTGVAAMSGNNQAIISWNAVPGATAYNIYYAINNPGGASAGTKIVSVSSPYNHTGLTNGTPYYYVVEPANNGGGSTVSAEVSTTPIGTPTGVSASASGTTVTVTWTNAPGAASHNIYWKTTSPVTKANGTLIAAATSPYPHTGLTYGSTYYYVVTAKAADGSEGAESSPEASAHVSWAVAGVIDNLATNATFPQVAVDSAGNATATWNQSVGGIENIYSNRYPVGSVWGAPVLIETSGTSATYSDVAVDSAGNAIAVWEQDIVGGYDSIRANRYVSGSVWGAPQTIDVNANLANPSDLISGAKIAFDPSAGGSAFAVWKQQSTIAAIDNIYANRYLTVGSPGGWQTAVAIEAQGTAATSPQVAVSSAGKAIAIWQQANDIYANVFSAGVWGTEAAIDLGPLTAGAASAPQVVFDPSGNAMAIWVQANDIVGNLYLAADGWSGASVAIDNDASAATPSAPQIAFDANGNAIAVWIQSGNVMANYYTSGGSWKATSMTLDNLATVASEPKIAFDTNGNAIAIWIQSDGVQASVYASRYVAATKTLDTPVLIENDSTAAASRPEVAVDGLGYATVVWQHGVDIWSNRGYIR